MNDAEYPLDVPSPIDREDTKKTREKIIPKRPSCSANSRLKKKDAKESVISSNLPAKGKKEIPIKTAAIPAAEDMVTDEINDLLIPSQRYAMEVVNVLVSSTAPAK